MGKPQKATLKPEHFEHLQEEYDWLRNLLSHALAKKQHGVNILIYGKPGTGKMELAQTPTQRKVRERLRTFYYGYVSCS